MSFVALQYPGVVKNVDKALVTLGGVAKLSEDHFKAGSIELDYHRDNVYSRSTCSRKRRGTVLIVRARRKKSDTASTADESIDVEVLGIAHTFYQFSAMFDFQYLPMKKNDNEMYESLLPKLVPQSMDSALSWFDPDPNRAVEKVDLFLPPFVFSRFTTATNNLVMCREVERRITKKSVAIGASLRVERKSAVMMVQGQDPFPTEPPLELQSTNDTRHLQLVEPNKIMQKIFEERPIWTKHAISFLSDLDPLMMKNLLPKYSFYILSGPWGRGWCKYGYDPRTTPESRKYQTMMFNARLQHQVNVSSRTSQLAKVRSQKDQRPTRREPVVMTELIYVYKPGELPPYRQMWYQICDVKLPKADALLQEEPESLPVADASYGWFRQGALDELREVVKSDFKETLRKLDREYSDLEDDDSPDDILEN